MRPFYPATRAHHAYVMALDFGMKFAKRDGFWTPEGLLTVTGAGGYRIEIAEESLALLEPRVGDLTTQDYRPSRYFTVREDNATYCAAESVAVSYAAELIGKGHLKIIHRDGLSFFWPEQAKAEAV